MSELLPMAEAIYEAHIAPLVKERDELKRQLGTVLDVRDQLAAARERLASQTKAAFREGYIAGYSKGREDQYAERMGAKPTTPAARSYHFEKQWRLSDAIQVCPHCGSTNTEHRHADTPNNAGTETDWRECEDCGHQWGHQ